MGFITKFIKAMYHTLDIVLACTFGGILGYFGVLHIQHGTSNTLWSFIWMFVLAMVFVFVYSLIRVYMLSLADKRELEEKE